MTATIVIPSRFCGPPDSGNGGWTCGSLAAHHGAQVEVTLRKPPPLDRRLTIAEEGDGLRLTDGEELIAEAASTDSAPEPPEPVSTEAAAEAAEGYKGFEQHIFPTCFTCGPERSEGDGLRIFAGPVEGRPHTVAACWTPHPSLTDNGDDVTEPIVWAALDCPSGWVHIGEGVVALLGRMTAQIRQPVRAGEPHVVVAESAGSDGRKRYSTSALFSHDGEPLAVARATWIVVEQ